MRLYEGRGYARKGREEHFYARNRAAFIYAKTLGSRAGSEAALLAQLLRTCPLSHAPPFTVPLTAFLMNAATLSWSCFTHSSRT